MRTGAIPSFLDRVSSNAPDPLNAVSQLLFCRHKHEFPATGRVQAACPIKIPRTKVQETQGSGLSVIMLTYPAPTFDKLTSGAAG